MTVIINETNEVKELSAIDISTGVDWTADLVSDDSEIVYDHDESCYRISQAAYDFWTDYINYMSEDDNEEELLRTIYDNAEIDKIMRDETYIINDYDARHSCYQKAFARIRSELIPEA